MPRSTLRTLLKSVAVVILAGLLASLVWASQPFIDRSKKGAAPVPFSRAPDALTAGQTARLIDFIENKAVGTEALLIVKNGQLIFEYGPTDEPSNLHSIRKSVLSILFGIAREKQLLDITATLAELGIDEPAIPLTDVEKSATVAMLLQARSGVYLTSGAETQQMKDGRPARGQFMPGEYYYYNNWDFNVLGTIFEQETGLTIGNALDQWLAQPLGMQDYHPSHVIYDTGTADTQYPTYRIHMSGRDLARIGLLIQNKGKWGAEQIVPADWVALTTARVSETKPGLMTAMAIFGG